MIRKCKDLIFEEPDFADPRIMALNIEIKGFKARVVSAYAPTDCDGSIHQKDSFYRELKKACKKQNKHQKLFINGDFNATTAAREGWPSGLSVGFLNMRALPAWVRIRPQAHLDRLS